MNNYTSVRTMPFAARQLYDLALDIESYPAFVPLCKRAELTEPESQDDGTIAMDSLLIFRFRKFGIYEEFRSRVTADPENLTIISEADGAPFKSFRAVWSFADVGAQAAEASIDVAYQFRSRALGMLLSRGSGVTNQGLIDAWENRAHEIYGSPDGVAA